MPDDSTVDHESTSLLQTELQASVLIERIKNLDEADVLVAYGFAENLKRLGASMWSMLTERVIGIMKREGIKEIAFTNTVAKKLDREKTEKPRNGYRPVIAAILEAAGGDVDKIADLIASDGIKPGALKALIGQEKFDELYETTWRDVLVKGNPTSKLVFIPKALLEQQQQQKKGSDHHAVQP